MIAEVFVAAAAGAAAVGHALTDSPVSHWAAYARRATRVGLAIIVLILAVNAAAVYVFLNRAIGWQPFDNRFLSAAFLGVGATVLLRVDLRGFGFGSTRQLSLPAWYAISAVLRNMKRQAADQVADHINRYTRQELIGGAHRLGSVVAGRDVGFYRTFQDSLKEASRAIASDDQGAAMNAIESLWGVLHESILVEQIFPSTLPRASGGVPFEQDWPYVERSQDDRVVDLREVPERRAGGDRRRGDRRSQPV